MYVTSILRLNYSMHLADCTSGFAHVFTCPRIILLAQVVKLLPVISVGCVGAVYRCNSTWL